MLNSFLDELVSHGGLRAPLVKTAKGKFYGRMGAIGGLAGAGSHALEALETGMSANPYDAPAHTLSGAAARGGIGGILAGLGLSTLGRLGGKKRKRRLFGRKKL